MMRDRKDIISHGQPGGNETKAARCVEQQTSMATNTSCALATDPGSSPGQALMEKICDRANLNRAYKRVKANKGAAGIDGVTIEEFREISSDHKEQLIQSLLEGSFEPQPVRGVKIPKAGGGERQLGIQTVRDRVVQQAILQVIEQIYDPEFSESSYGFRPKKSAHDALKKAGEYVEQGYVWVVDMDLEKFFDRVNHDIL